ncbi:hypothetical protein JOD31_001110 [Methylopila capsulata]|uniref:Uncharacterized protein n=1 Tax=Methylopila capsulata TaxID=61654 RepID=A0A9W6IV65_9HYPH|nr:hypothetical protein [Methylopila sp. 73B]MBM7850898.1 hypothetical protein [Methylopila capsulata]GLK56194.1 hypothetical protein GCM10008170_22130 [Methylopila capsulata]
MKTITRHPGRSGAAAQSRDRQARKTPLLKTIPALRFAAAGMTLEP